MDPRVLRVTELQSLADEWHLCLSAEGVPHHIEPVDGKLAVVVLESDLARADQMLAEYDQERRERAIEPQAPSVPDAPSVLGPVAAVALIGFHAATLPFRERFLAAGAATAQAITHGQPWRAVTALTLHADYMHVAGNSIAALIFFTALGRWLGSGVAALWIVLAGALGNLLNAAVHDAGFSSIGASTATFAAVGLLVALQLRRRRKASRRERYWLPIAGGLGLFAMLGTGGKQTDVLAHVFGLLSGGALGLLASGQRRRTLVQLLAAGGSVAIVVGAWWLALHSSANHAG